MKKILSTRKNDIKVDLFELRTDNEEEMLEVKQFLIERITKSKVHMYNNYFTDSLSGVFLKDDFRKKICEKIKEITYPKNHSIIQFDVKRERVTEWIARLTLEKYYKCIFYDEADKRMNVEATNVNKHTDGIDVPGIMIDNDDIKFVVCEVKASESTCIPCSSVNSLQEDIQKAIDNSNNRISSEILELAQNIKNVAIRNEIINRIIESLAHMLAKDNDDLINNIYFFPFLIRNCNKIIDEKNVDDFDSFIINNANKENVNNVLLHFNANYDEFSKEIYQEALEND